MLQSAVTTLSIATKWNDFVMISASLLIMPKCLFKTRLYQTLLVRPGADIIRKDIHPTKQNYKLQIDKFRKEGGCTVYVTKTGAGLAAQLIHIFVFHKRKAGIPENTRTENSTCTYQFFVYG